MTPQSSDSEELKESDAEESSDQNFDDNEECGSSDDDMESGSFFRQIERDKSRANHERKYLIDKLRSK